MATYKGKGYDSKYDRHMIGKQCNCGFMFEDQSDRINRCPQCKGDFEFGGHQIIWERRIDPTELAESIRDLRDGDWGSPDFDSYDSYIAGCQAACDRILAMLEGNPAQRMDNEH